MQIRSRCKHCNGNFQSTINASPDLAVATAADQSDVGYFLSDPIFDPTADPMADARHYGKLNFPMTNMVQPGFGPFFRRPQGYDPEAWALVYSFNDTQFDRHMQYFRRDSLYQLRELGELHRLLFCFFRGLAACIKELNLTWAATYQSQLDSIARQYDTGS